MAFVKNVEGAIKMMTRIVGSPGWDVTPESAGFNTNALVLVQYQKDFGHVRAVPVGFALLYCMCSVYCDLHSFTA